MSSSSSSPGTGKLASDMPPGVAGTEPCLPLIAPSTETRSYSKKGTERRRRMRSTIRYMDTGLSSDTPTTTEKREGRTYL